MSDIQRALADMLRSDRSAKIMDPRGRLRDAATHIQKVPAAELARRAEQWSGNSE